MVIHTFSDIEHTKDIFVRIDDEVRLIQETELRIPRLAQYRFIVRQTESALLVESSHTFTYNLPTHYLAWTIILD